MNRRPALAALAAPVLLLLSGCHCLDCGYEPMNHEHAWDRVLGSCDACGVCGGQCPGHTPCSYAKHMLTCGSGCGELYWDEWLSDPPDACDPCDNCGNWIGPQLPGPSCFHRFLAGSCSLWGYRWMGQGCDAFPGEPTVDLFGDEGIVIENESVVEGQPVEAIPPKAKADPGQGTKQPTPAQPVPDRHARRPTQLRSWGSLPASFRSYRMQ